MAKEKHQEHENHEAWIIPYADMVTLLFAFFVVMYAMSLQDEKKMKIVSESVSDAFIGTAKGGDRTKQIDITGIKGSPPTARRFVMKRNITNQEIIDEIRESLETEGFDVLYQDEASPIQYRIDERGVIISISAGYLFSANSTEIPPELYPVIGVVADVIKETERLVLVEGHTDDLPVVGTKYFDNWDLSVLRGSAMVKLLIDQFSIDPRILTASGMAQYKPIANNTSKTGRAQNRRVDIIMLNSRFADEMYADGPVPGKENQ